VALILALKNTWENTALPSLTRLYFGSKMKSCSCWIAGSNRSRAVANLFKLTKGSRGRWRWQNLGRKRGAGAQFVPATFFLEADYGEACRRVVLLEQMWEAVSNTWAEADPLPGDLAPTRSPWRLPVGRRTSASARRPGPIRRVSRPATWPTCGRSSPS
jgi:hypothetical protein